MIADELLIAAARARVGGAGIHSLSNLIAIYRNWIWSAQRARTNGDSGAAEGFERKVACYAHGLALVADGVEAREARRRLCRWARTVRVFTTRATTLLRRSDTTEILLVLRPGKGAKDNQNGAL